MNRSADSGELEDALRRYYCAHKSKVVSAQRALNKKNSQCGIARLQKILDRKDAQDEAASELRDVLDGELYSEIEFDHSGSRAGSAEPRIGVSSLARNVTHSACREARCRAQIRHRRDLGPDPRGARLRGDGDV